MAKSAVQLNDPLNDEQLMAALAITRGDITARDGDEYMDLSLGNWSDDDDNSVSLLSRLH